MTDKFDLQIPPNTPFTPQFHQLFQSNQHVVMKRRCSRYRCYRVGSFEEFGYDATLEMDSRPDHPSKLSIIGAGTKSKAWIQEEVEKIYAVNSVSGLRVLRYDAAVDLPLNLDWLYNNSRVLSKHSVLEHRGGSGLQTVYFGDHPNQLVMYDKKGERLRALARRMGQTARHADVQAMYSDTYNRSLEEPWTRIENRYWAKAIPSHMSTFEKYWNNVSVFDPFDAVEIVPFAEAEPECSNCSLSLLAKVELIGRRIRSHGHHATRRWLDQLSTRNGSKWWKQVEPYLAKSSEIAVPNLNQLFQQSVSRQLAA